jgi:hypothetical protein
VQDLDRLIEEAARVLDQLEARREELCLSAYDLASARASLKRAREDRPPADRRRGEPAMGLVWLIGWPRRLAAGDGFPRVYHDEDRRRLRGTLALVDESHFIEWLTPSALELGSFRYRHASFFDGAAHGELLDELDLSSAIWTALETGWRDYAAAQLHLLGATLPAQLAAWTADAPPSTVAAVRAWAHAIGLRLRDDWPLSLAFGDCGSLEVSIDALRALRALLPPDQWHGAQERSLMVGRMARALGPAPQLSQLRGLCLNIETRSGPLRLIGEERLGAGVPRLQIRGSASQRAVAAEALGALATWLFQEASISDAQAWSAHVDAETGAVLLDRVGVRDRGRPFRAPDELRQSLFLSGPLESLAEYPWRQSI